MEKNGVVVFTYSYPFGRGETFLKNELEVLSSFFSPDSVVQDLFVARPMVHTAAPVGVYRSSGSRVRFPMSCTLFKLRADMVIYLLFP